MNFVGERLMKRTLSMLKNWVVGVQLGEEIWDTSVVMSQFFMKKL